MKNFNLYIHEGIDLVKFGMTQQEIRDILTIEPDFYNQSVSYPPYQIIQEYYGSFLQVNYEEDNGILKCCGISITDEKAKVFLDGVQIMGMKRDEAISFFTKKFEDCEIDTCGLTSEKYGFGANIEIQRNRISKIRGMHISRKGYLKEVSDQIK